MGGGDGTVIVQDSLKSDLGSPLVSARVPQGMHAKMVGLLALDPSQWSIEQFCFLDHCRSCAYFAMKS